MSLSILESDTSTSGKGLPASDSEWRRAFRSLRKSPLAIAGIFIIGSLLVVAIFAPHLAPYHPNETHLSERLRPPSRMHILGTDDVGRDILSRIIYGSRISLRICTLVVGFTIGIGSILGIAAGYRGGWVDDVIMRLADTFLAFPALILAMAITSALGPRLENVVLALVVIWWPRYARVTRGQVLILREMDYIVAAKAIGVSERRLILRHLVPNCISSVVVQATLDMGEVLLTAATLSFIGFGAQAPSPEWGAMVSLGRTYLRNYWWLATFPGIAILLTVIGFNLLGDAVRDVLDPRMRRGVQ